MPADLHALMRRWFEEVWNQGREETVDELFALDGVAHGLGEGAENTHGRDKFKVFLRSMRQALPDVRVEVEDSIAEDDRIVARVMLTGTHLGEGLGFPPSGRSVAVRAMIFTRFADGQIVEGWNSWDQLGFLQQVGALPKGQHQFISE
jgi:steroid delta-isomerase-like uncharacterized protein